MILSKWIRAALVPALVLGAGAFALAVPDDDEKAAGEAYSKTELVRLSRFDDYTLRGRDGKELGSVQAVAVDVDRASVKYFILDPGIASEPVALPWSMIEVDHGQKMIDVYLSQEELAKAPRFQSGAVWPEEIDTTWLPAEARDRHEQYEQEREERFAPDASGSQPDVPLARADEPAEGRLGAQKPPDTTQSRTDDPSGTAGDDRKQPLTRVLSSSTLIGMNVQGSARGEIGEIDDLVLETKKGKVIAGVMSHGGLLGIGQTHYLVPFRAFRFEVRDGAHVPTLDIDEKRLEKAPTIDKNAQILDASAFERACQFYGVQKEGETKVPPAKQPEKPIEEEPDLDEPREPDLDEPGETDPDAGPPR